MLLGNCSHTKATELKSYVKILEKLKKIKTADWNIGRSTRP